MADITAADVTYTPAGYPHRQLTDRYPVYKNKVTVEFGDGVLTYPSGGVPLSGNQLEFPQGIIETVTLPSPFDNPGGTTSSTTFWAYDDVSQKLRGYTTGNVEISGTVALTTLMLYVTGY